MIVNNLQSCKAKKGNKPGNYEYKTLIEHPRESSLKREGKNFKEWKN